MKSPADISSAAAAAALQSFGAAGAPPPIQWRRIALITAGACALFVGVRYLPTGTNLSHMDFRATGQNVIETCDPANPQFIPVVAVKSPVAMSLVVTRSAIAGSPVTASAALSTASGKAIAPEDLVVMHTKLLHLLVTDPTLTDYQHVHPTPGRTPGSWDFQFTPRRAGNYRVFADFTPVATGRSLYANADLVVAAASGAGASSDGTAQSAQSIAADAEHAGNSGRFPDVVLDGYTFSLAAGNGPIVARKMADLKFTVSRADGARVPMEPVMGAYAHLVAFNEARSGFAHLHPMEVELIPAPDALRPTLNFKITIPTAGRYVIWSQVNLGGREIFAPFWFDVAAK